MPSLNVSGEVRIMKNYISTWLNISMTINVKEDSRIDALIPEQLYYLLKKPSAQNEYIYNL